MFHDKDGTAWRDAAPQSTRRTMDACERGVIGVRAYEHIKEKRRWTDAEIKYIDRWSGTRTLAEMGVLLHRSERSLRCQLHRQGLSAKQNDGWSLKQLRTDLHLRSPLVLRYAAQGILRIQSAQVCINHDALGTEPSNTRQGSIRAAPFIEAAKKMGLTRKQLLSAALAGHCQLIHVRITDESVLRLCASPYFLPIRARISPTIDRWLRGNECVETKKVIHAVQPRHLSAVHHCLGCGRSIRGIAFYRHKKHCEELGRLLNR